MIHKNIDMARSEPEPDPRRPLEPLPLPVAWPKRIAPGMRHTAIVFMCGCITEGDEPESSRDRTDAVCAEHKQRWFRIINFHRPPEGIAA